MNFNFEVSHELAIIISRLFNPEKEEMAENVHNYYVLLVICPFLILKSKDCICTEERWGYLQTFQRLLSCACCHSCRGPQIVKLLKSGFIFFKHFFNIRQSNMAPFIYAN